MIVEQLLYAMPSDLVTGQLVLQPEITKTKTFFNGELVDAALVVESFYRLYRIIRIRTGRAALSQITSFDPIITVHDENITFETFSNDVTNYACLTLEKSAFQNISNWIEGQTNVDFSPTFIKQLRGSSANAVKAIKVDPEGFSVDAGSSDLHEKKVTLPENWKIALDHIRDVHDSSNSISALDDPIKFVKNTVFGPFLRKFSSVSEGWIPKEGWQFARLDLRGNLGDVIIGTTGDVTKRFDGRENPKYEAIRDIGTLRLLKSYLLTVEKIHGNTWEVSGGGKVHLVQKRGTSYACDCKDSRYGNTTCKHVHAVIKPKMRILNVGEDKWRVITMAGKKLDKHTVAFKNMKFSCTCNEFKNTNICLHVVEILKHEEDFQFNELVEDLT